MGKNVQIAASDVETASLENRIRRRAHEIYLERTALQSEKDDWFQAELEIKLAEEHNEINRDRRAARL